MAVREKDVNESGAEEALGGPSWLAKLDEFGQKHARLILTVSAGLIVLTVLIIANVVMAKSRAERVSRDLARAQTLEEIRQLKERYAGSPEAAIILFALGNKLAAEGKLEDALKEYDEFLQRHPDHELRKSLAAARQGVEDNLKFEREQKHALLEVPALETHPLKDVKLARDLQKLRDEHARLLKDPTRKEEADAVAREIGRRLASPAGIGPIRLPNPLLKVKIADKENKPKTEFTLELFPDEAPQAIAALLELAETGHFNGLKPMLVGDERLQVPPKQGTEPKLVPFERTRREGEVGSLLVVRQGDRNIAGEFQLLLKSVEEPGDVTVAGILPDEKDRTEARKVTAEDIIESVTVERKRPTAP